MTVATVVIGRGAVLLCLALSSLYCCCCCHAFVLHSQRRLLQRQQTSTTNQLPFARHPFLDSSSTLSTTLSTTTTRTTTAKTSATALSMMMHLPSAVLATVSDATTSSSAAVWNSPLWTYFLETLISNGVPALFTIVVVGFVALQFRRKREDRFWDGDDDDDEEWYEGTVVSELYNDLYGDGASNSNSNNNNNSLFQGLRRLLRKRKRSSSKDSTSTNFINLGVPTEEYFRITHLNRKMDSYQYSMTAATTSKAKAAANYRALNFQRAIQRGFDSTSTPALATGTLNNNDDDASTTTTSTTVPPPVIQWNNITLSQQTGLFLAEKDFLEKGRKVAAKLQQIQSQITQWAIDDEIYDKFDQMTPDVLDPDTTQHRSSSYQQLNKNRTSLKDVNTKKQKKSSSLLSSLTSSSSKTTTPSTSNNKEQHDRIDLLLKQWIDLQQEMLKLELAFAQDIINISGPERANGIRTALLGNGGAVGTLLLQLQERPLRALLFPETTFTTTTTTPTTTDTTNGDEIVETTTGDDTTVTDAPVTAITTTTAAPSPSKRLYVAKFDGDVSASQVSNLREEVTAIVRHARPGIDEALVILETGGGTVTGYGLAAAQLVRLRDKGIRLTIAAEQVAASGGYMMCSVGDHIVASPFCVLGSIGVISDIPNVYERLKQEGIEFQTVTAGKYKRTLTPTKKVTKEDAEKTKEDLEAVLSLFRNFVKTYRPQLDIEQVATGETWFGTDALEKGLCDEIKPVDDVLTEFMDRGYNVYELEYSPPPTESGSQLGRLLPFGRAERNSYNNIGGGGGGGGLLSSAVRWLVRTIAAEVRAELNSLADEMNPAAAGKPFDKRSYMLMDESSDRIRSND